MDEPDKGSLRKLGKHEIKRLIFHRILDPHDGVTKYAGSRQDVYIDWRSGDLWVARKHSPSHFEPLYVNPRDEGVPGFD